MPRRGRNVRPASRSTDCIWSLVASVALAKSYYTWFDNQSFVRIASMYLPWAAAAPASLLGAGNRQLKPLFRC